MVGELGLHTTARDSAFPSGGDQVFRTRLLNQQMPEGGWMGEQRHPALPSLGGALVSSSFLFFSTAGVLKGARCGSESKGGEGLGGGVAETLGWVEGQGQNAPTYPRGHPATGGTPRSRALSFHLPAGPWERSEGRDDKLFQVSSGKQGGEGYRDSCHSNITLET